MPDKKEIEERLSDLTNEVHGIDKAVSTLSVKVDELSKDREKCTETCNARMDRIEDNFSTQITSVIANNQKITYALLGIVAALAGAEAVIKGLGHTPVIAEVAFYGAVFYYLVLAIYVLYRALRGELNLILLGAAIILIFTAMIRINLGFLSPGSTSLEIAIGGILGSILCAISGVKEWISRG